MRRYLIGSLNRRQRSLTSNQLFLERLCSSVPAFRRNIPFRLSRQSIYSSSPRDEVNVASSRKEDSIVSLLNESIDENTNKQPDPLTQQTKLFLSHFAKHDETSRTANPSSNDKLKTTCLDLIHSWFQLQADLEQSVISSSDERITLIRGRRTLPHSSSPHHAIIVCAKNIHILLQHYILLLKNYKIQETTQNKSLPFQLAMVAMNRSCQRYSTFYYPFAGYHCASILDEWGSLYGGDLINAPTTQAFNLCLEALAFCSSGTFELGEEEIKPSRTFDDDDHTNHAFTFPAIQAWKIFDILNQDFVLRPSLETYSHVITALTHHCFAMKYSTTLQEYTKSLNPEHQPSSISTMTSYTAATLAFQTWALLENTLDSHKAAKHSTSPHQQILILEAIANILALISRGFLTDDPTNHKDIKQTLSVPEKAEFVFSRLRLLIQDETFFPKDTALSSTHSQYLRDAYLSCMIAYTTKHHEQSSVDEKVKTANLIMKLFHELEEKSFEEFWENSSPHSSHYNAVINAFATCFDNAQRWTVDDKNLMSDLQAHRKCWNMLERMEAVDYSHKFYENDPMDVQQIYCRIIWILSQSVRFGLCSNDTMAMAINADTALMSLINKYQNGSLRQFNPPDITRAVNHVMLLHSHPSLNKLSQDKISTLFTQLIEWSHSSDRKAPKPDEFTYSLYMNHLSRLPADDSVQKMLTLLKDMETQYENGASLVRPNIVHYCTAIKVIGKVGRKKHTVALLDIFRRAEELLTLEEKDFNPVILYSSYISALSEIGYPSCGIEALEIYRKLWERYKETKSEKYQPDVILFNTILDAISKSKVVDQMMVSEAEAILDNLETMYLNGKDVIPHRAIYTSLMNIWTKAGLEDAAEKCVEMIERMTKIYNETGNDDIFPDVVSYSVTLDAMTQNPSPQSVEKALTLFSDMEERSRNGFPLLKPNVIIYTKLIKAIWKSNPNEAGILAENVLDVMEERCRDGDFTTNPDCHTYTCVINCWGRSNHLEKVTKAWDILQRMKKNYEQGNLTAMPNVVTFTSLLNCCAHAPNEEKAKNDAVLVATKAFHLLVTNPHFGYPNSITYRTLLEVFGRNIKDFKIRNNHSSKIFQHCSNGGMVDKTVLMTLKRYTNDLYKQLPSTLPKSWSRNT